ncbi:MULTISPECIES: hypothetical protein [Mycolicibacter]|uniref:PE family protein n=2 Tax=Mycolicibacter TaxID=1073531 RepID=A0ABU5XL00_9MYCO|nr:MULTISPECIES: hypothetical protein [unclassified Mycolicibacter]MEB3022960.1 hypothetical protein [Mycolicibacter sp. MYC098]MEB3033470.1 hypothetical protein [Mycolicibacter sp. MYC340]
MAEPNTLDIKASPDTLRATAASLEGLLGEIDAVLVEAKSVHDATTKEASVGTIDQNPAPYFSPLLDALGVAGGNMVKNIEQLKANIAHDAETLVKIADGIEHTEQTNAAKITNI